MIAWHEAEASAAQPPGRRRPRCSVIIPTRNRAQWLRETVDSALQQTCPDVEVLVVDDGSTDDTRDVVAAYGDRVRYLFTPGRRAGHARNVGMAAAQGQYLAFVDDDDHLYPYMLEVESRLLDRYPDVAMVYAEMSAFDERGVFDRFHLKTYHDSAYRDPRLTYDRIFESSARLGDIGVLPRELVQQDPSLLERRAYFGHVFDEYLVNIVIFQNNMLVRHEVVDRVGVRNERVRYYEELDYILRITRQYRVAFVDVPTYKMRFHAGQVSSLAGPDGRFVWLRKQQELLRLVKRHALQDADYYARHQTRLDRHLAHLHRAVAVPLMVSDAPPQRRRTLARRARLYLRRCQRYGHPARWLWLLTFAPSMVRRVGIGVVDELRERARRWATRHVRRAA